MQGSIKGWVGATPETLVRYAQILYDVNRPGSVRQVRRQLDVSTPLTQTGDHLGFLDLGRCAEEVSQLLNFGDVPT